MFGTSPKIVFMIILSKQITPILLLDKLDFHGDQSIKSFITGHCINLKTNLGSYFFSFLKALKNIGDSDPPGIVFVKICQSAMGTWFPEGH